MGLLRLMDVRGPGRGGKVTHFKGTFSYFLSKKMSGGGGGGGGCHCQREQQIEEGHNVHAQHF